MCLAVISVCSLPKRADFLRIASKGQKVATKGLVLQAAPTSLAEPGMSVRVGFTVTKKLGNAVIRNRIRRRLRAAARSVFPALGKPGIDYVIIGRQPALDRDFGALIKDLRYALHNIGKETVV